MTIQDLIIFLIITYLIVFIFGAYVGGNWEELNKSDVVIVVLVTIGIVLSLIFTAFYNLLVNG